MAYNFSGKRALVTGASRGIGKEIVEHLAKRNAEIIALDINQHNLNILKNEIPSIQIVCVDISDWKETRKAIEKLGAIDLLVNNAGILKKCSFQEITEEDIDGTLAVNVKPIINISQVVIKTLKERGMSGSIVNMSSASATGYSPSLAVYSASKAIVVKLTETMAVELGPYGIRTNAVNPIWVPTDMSSFMVEGKNADKIKNFIPLRKLPEKSDVADAVLFLLSDEAKMINGTCLYVNGGGKSAF